MSTMTTEGLTISEAAVAAGVSAHTLRYYERATPRGGRGQLAELRQNLAAIERKIEIYRERTED